MVTSKVSGRIVDRKTKEGVTGALIIVLKPGVSTADFIKQQKREMALSSVRSAADGRFELPDPLPTGASYSVIVVARDYADTVLEEAVRIGASASTETKLTPIRLDRI